MNEINPKRPSIELYDYQLDAIKELHNGSVLVGGVGSGKTLTAIVYAFSKVRQGRHPMVGDKSYSKGKDIPVYVITTARKRFSSDWERESANLYFLPTVDSWNNIARYTHVKDAFFIFDEQRLVGSGVWVKSFYKIAAQNQWILLTATPGDTWLEYAPIFIANGFYKNKTDFERQHVVWSRWSKYPKVDRYVGVNKLIHNRKRIVVNMTNTKKTRRHTVIHQIGHDRERTAMALIKRWNVFEDKPIPNSSTLIYILRKITNTDPARLEKLMEVFNKHKKVIVFYNFDYELEILEKFAEENNIKYTQWNGHKHEPLLKDEKEWLYLCQYTSASEAWNATETDAILFFSQNYSYKVLEQASGRIDRLNTPFIDLWYYHIVSTAPIDLAIRKAIREKRIFNEARFQDF